MDADGDGTRSGGAGPDDGEDGEGRVWRVATGRGQYVLCAAV